MCSATASARPRWRIGISAGGIGDDRDTNRVGIRFRRADIALRGFDAAADAAEQIDFVSDFQPGRVIGRCVGATLVAPACPAGTNATLRQPIDLHLAQ